MPPPSPPRPHRPVRTPPGDSNPPFFRSPSADSNPPFESSGPRSLTTDPDIHRKGRKVLDQCRLSVQLKSIDKLGRCRLIFHHISNYSCQLTEDLQNKIFGFPAFSQSNTKYYGRIISEYHVHASLSERSNKFSQPEPGDCIYSANPATSTCSFEMHETVERVFQRTAVDPESRNSLLTLPDDVSSGPVSVASIKRYSSITPADIDANKMHIEVLSLTGECAARCKAWCSPIIYCKHSINVIVTDVEALINSSNLDSDLSRVLSEIKAYSRDVNAATESEHSLDGKVLLVLTSMANYSPQQVKEFILFRLGTYRSMLIATKDDRPFVLLSQVAELSTALFRELRRISESSMASLQNYRYPHAGVMLAQKFIQREMDVVDLQTLKGQLRESIALESGGSDPEKVASAEGGTLHYLHNTGIMYIPG